MIKQSELRSLYKLRKQMDTMKRDLSTMEAEERLIEAAVMQRIEEKEKVERGDLTPGIQERQVLGKVSWKEVVAERCGPRVVDEVLASRVPSTVKELVIIAGKKDA